MLPGEQPQVARLGARGQAVLGQQPPPVTVRLATLGGQGPIVIVGRLGFVGGGFALGLERQQGFEAGEHLFGRLQPHDQRPAALGQPLVERVALGAGLGELIGQEARLFVAIVDAAGGRALEHDFHPRRTAGGQHAHQRPGSTDGGRQ